MELVKQFLKILPIITAFTNKGKDMEMDYFSTKIETDILENGQKE